MNDKYASLRAALEDFRGISIHLPVDPPTTMVLSIHPSVIRTLLAERDTQAAEIERLREALQKVRPLIEADRQGLLDCHGIHGKIPAEDELGTYGLHECDGALYVIDAALSGEPT